MSKIEFSVDLNGKLVPGELQATLFHQLHRQAMAQCTTIIEGIDTIGYLAPFAMIQAYYASRGEAVPPAMQPRAEVLAEPADEDNDIEEILHVPAWPGGLPVPRVLSTFGSVYPALNIANITIAQNAEVQRRRDAEKVIQNRNEQIKMAFLSKLPREIIDTMQQAEFELGQLHISQMDVRQTMAWAMNRFGGVPSEDVSKATLLVHKPFSVNDLINADSLDIAMAKRLAILSTLEENARPTFFMIRPKIDNAGRGHPAYGDLIKYHYNTTVVANMSFNTLRIAVRAKYNDLIALYTEAIVVWTEKNDNASASLAKAHVPTTNRKQAGGGANTNGGSAGTNECREHLLGRNCGPHAACRGSYPHDTQRHGSCKTFINASDKAKLFDSMPADQQKAVRAAAKEAKEGNNKKGSNLNKGGTIASAPASNNRRYNGRANATSSADDDVVSSEED